jgi:Rieske Fe-S protein
MPNRTRPPPGCPRRRFLEIAGRVVACAALTPALAGCEVSELLGGTTPAELPFDIAAPPYAPLAEVSGIVSVDSGRKRLLLLRTSATEVIALDRLCTHQGCDLDPLQAGTWDPARGELTCRCHRAIFDAHGAVLSGPAPTALPRYAVSFDPATGKGVVTLG